MRNSKVPALIMIALFVLGFGLAARLQPWFEAWTGDQPRAAGLLGLLLGDSRHMFANQSFVMADVYFHRGFYPGIFDNQEAFHTPHIAEDSGAVRGQNKGDELSFLDKPRDWIEAFSRQFFPSKHTHLDDVEAHKTPGSRTESAQAPPVREILPWLELSAALDPSRVETYTVAAYWLRQRLGRVAEAEQFLREGLRANPHSYQIQVELGRVYAENRHDPARARNLWELALDNWKQQEAGQAEPDYFFFLQITSHLALLEEQQGNYGQALRYLEMWKSHSPSPAAIQQRIDNLRRK